MKTSYFTFGQNHVHSINGFTYDKDVVVSITSDNPRTIMFEYFNSQWGFEYDSEPSMELFPRGIKKLS